jgi:hypothetical protein
MVHLLKGDDKVTFGHEAILTRPNLAAHIGAVAAIWTVIEESWGHILAEALDADPKTGVAMYLALTGAASQGAVLLEAVKMHLPDGIQTMIAAARKLEKGVGKDRNRIVHGRWGIVNEDDRYLVLGERDWLPRALAHTRDMYTNPERYTLPSWSDHPDMEKTLYSEKDFIQIERRMIDHYRSLHAIIVTIDAWRSEKRLIARMAATQKDLGLGLLGQPRDPHGPAE